MQSMTTTLLPTKKWHRLTGTNKLRDRYHDARVRQWYVGTVSEVTLTEMTEKAC